MEIFKAREVVLATVNIKRLLKKGCTRIAPDDLICSTRTFSLAMAQLKQENYNV